MTLTPPRTGQGLGKPATSTVGRTEAVRPVERAELSEPHPALVPCCFCGVIAAGAGPPGWGVAGQTGGDGVSAGYGVCPACLARSPAAARSAVGLDG